MKASVLLLTFNEEANLPACLASLRWCDDIVVVDSGSTDRTTQIASEQGARVLVRPFENFAQQRNFGLDHGNFRHDWILHLDADEIVPDLLAKKIAEMEPSKGTDAYLIPSKIILFGRWLRYAGMYPSYQVRLGHVQRLRFKQVGHGQREDLAPDRVSKLDEPYLHYSFSHGLRRWLEKHVDYAHDEAIQLLADRKNASQTSECLFSMDGTMRRRALKRISSYVPLLLRPILRFFYIYIIRLGFLDGAIGAAYALMLSVYEGMIAVLAIEKMQGNNPQTHRAASRTDIIGEP